MQGGVRCCRRAQARQATADTGAAFGAVARNANLRWLELAWTASIVGHYAFLIAVSVYAYNEGGEKAVGLVFLARLIPAALISPFAGLLGDRYRRDRVLLITNATRIVLVGAAAGAVFLDASSTIVYALSIAATIATTPFRSSQAALTPTLAQSPTELTAANAVASGMESIAIFVGPALAGILLGLASTGLVFTLTALMIVASTIFLLLMDRAFPAQARDRSRNDPRRGIRGLHDARATPSAPRDDGAPHGADRDRRCCTGVHRRVGDRAARPR